MFLEIVAQNCPPEAKTDEELKKIRISIHNEIASKVCVYHSMLVQHMMGKVQKLDVWVPCQLTAANMTRHYEICMSLFARNRWERILHQIITCNNQCILYTN